MISDTLTSSIHLTPFIPSPSKERGKMKRREAQPLFNSPLITGHPEGKKEETIW